MQPPSDVVATEPAQPDKDGGDAAAIAVLRSWSAAYVSGFLRRLGVHDEAVRVFAAEDVDGNCLLDLNENDLKSFGLVLGDRRRIIRGISTELRRARKHALLASSPGAAGVVPVEAGASPDTYIGGVDIGSGRQVCLVMRDTNFGVSSPPAASPTPFGVRLEVPEPSPHPGRVPRPAVTPPSPARIPATAVSRETRDVGVDASPLPSSLARGVGVDAAVGADAEMAAVDYADAGGGVYDDYGDDDEDDIGDDGGHWRHRHHASAYAPGDGGVNADSEARAAAAEATGPDGLVPRGAMTTLWLIFTYYTMHASSPHVERMPRTAFVKFCRHCRVIGDAAAAAFAGATAAAAGSSLPPQQPLSETEVDIVFAKIVQRDGAQPGARNAPRSCRRGATLSFAMFLDACGELACAVYARRRRYYARASFARVAFAAFVRRSVLPLTHARRRLARPVAGLLRHRLVAVYLSRVAPALRQLFAHYAGRAASREAPILLDYTGFMRFCVDFLRRPVPLLRVHCTEAFLSSLGVCADDDGTGGDDDAAVRALLVAPRYALTYDAFFECLLRCALLAYRACTRVPVTHKLKELVASMAQRPVESTDHHALLAGARRLQRAVQAVRREDGILGSYLFRYEGATVDIEDGAGARMLQLLHQAGE